MNRRTFSLLVGFGALGTLGNVQAQPMAKLDEQPHTLGPEVLMEDSIYWSRSTRFLAP